MPRININTIKRNEKVYKDLFLSTTLEMFDIYKQSFPDKTDLELTGMMHDNLGIRYTHLINMTDETKDKLDLYANKVKNSILNNT